MNTSTLRRKRVILPAIATVAALGVGGVAWSSAANADLQGGERDRVSSAATAAVGGGTVLDAEASDDRGVAYEVEVRTDDGREVDVSLDEQLTVVGRDGDAVDDTRDADVSDDIPDADDSVDDTTDIDDTTGTDDTDDTDDTRDADVRDDTTGTDDTRDADDRALSAAERRSAEKAALSAVGGGTVVYVAASDDRGEAYEVEVRKADNTDWDVELDADFKVLRKTADR